MRTIIFIVLAIIVSAGLYTAYGILTFEPQKPAPLVFQEPDPDTLKHLFAEKDLVTQQMPLSSRQEEAADEAVQKISQAMTIYKEKAEAATPRLKTSLAILNSSIGGGKLPAYFLSTTDAAHPAREFETLDFDPASEAVVTDASKNVSCSGKGGAIAHILIGDDADNTLSCDAEADSAPDSRADQFFLGGPGDDIISDMAGSRIVNSGSGNDRITLGPGRSIIILEEGWGQDTLTADCAGATVTPADTPQGFPVPWTYKFTNFIVLSPRIQAENISWKDKVLTNSATGDSLSVNENCFTLIGSGLLGTQ